MTKKWQLRSGRIYILPTQFGLLMLLAAVSILVAGAVYANNLVNMLAFFLFSLIFISMIQTNMNLKNITVSRAEISSAHAGETLEVRVALQNNSQLQKGNIETYLPGLNPISKHNLFDMQEPRSGKLYTSRYEAPARGHYRVTRLGLKTRFPIGLFEAWMFHDIEADFYIYPEAKGDRPLPIASLLPEDSHRSTGAGGDDFHSHRNYQKGDSQRRIDWRALAKGRPLLIKNFSAGDPKALELSWHLLSVSSPSPSTTPSAGARDSNQKTDPVSTRAPEIEDRLSQLTQWIIKAQTQGLAFSLSLPNQKIEIGHDWAHHRKCLEELARYNRDTHVL